MADKCTPPVYRPLPSDKAIESLPGVDPLQLSASAPRDHPKTRIGLCKWCKRPDAELYVQAKETHNDECNFCHPLYRAILGHPDREKGNGKGRSILTRVLREIAREVAEKSAAAEPRNAAEREILERLEVHPARKAGSVARALELIRSMVR